MGPKSQAFSRASVVTPTPNVASMDGQVGLSGSSDSPHR